MLLWGRFVFQGVLSVVKVRVACSCGNSLAVPVQYRGKRVKCPKCAQAVSVPNGNAQKAVAGATRRETVSSPMADLLNEVGFDKSRSELSCPNCKTEFEPDTVLCVSCGFNIETGKLLRTKRIETRDPLGLKNPTGNKPTGAKQFIAPGLVLGSCLIVGIILGLFPVDYYEAMGLDRSQAEIVATYAKFVVMGIGLLVAIALVLKNRPKGKTPKKP
jgi:Zn finger protein HypA/HybF involved in hydrogenase expression